MKPRCVPKGKFHEKLRSLGYGFKDPGPRWDSWKLKGSVKRVNVPKSACPSWKKAKLVLLSAGLSDAEATEFTTREAIDNPF